MTSIKLYDTYVHENSDNVTMDCYLISQNPGINTEPTPAVVIFPGGAYRYCSTRESEPIANTFLAHGYSAFVVWYTVAPNCNIVNPLLDAAQAIHTIRAKAEEFHVNPNKIAVCGFSAGGHLAAYISTCWHNSVISQGLNIDVKDARPDAAILAYPVISGTDHPNKDTFQALFGKEDITKEELEKVSLEKLVDKDTCPAFVWHTANDGCVPVQNSLMYCNALAAYNIPFELHVFPRGLHGLSLADRLTCPEVYSPYVARWVDMCMKWCENVFYNGDFNK